MPQLDTTDAVIRTAMIAGAMGGIARVLVAIREGSRGWALLLDAGLGATLGVCAAGAVIWWEPDLRDLGWPTLILASAAGCVGAIGTRVLDLLTEALKRRIGLL